MSIAKWTLIFCFGPKPAFPEPVRAPRNAPNVVIIMTDDTGFGQASTFGGPIPTPTLDRLAKERRLPVIG